MLQTETVGGKRQVHVLDCYVFSSLCVQFLILHTVRLETLLHFLNVCAASCDGMESRLLSFSFDFKCIFQNTNMQGFWPVESWGVRRPVTTGAARAALTRAFQHKSAIYSHQLPIVQFIGKVTDLTVTTIDQLHY